MNGKEYAEFLEYKKKKHDHKEYADARKKEDDTAQNFMWDMHNAREGIDRKLKEFDTQYKKKELSSEEYITKSFYLHEILLKSYDLNEEDKPELSSEYPHFAYYDNVCQIHITKYEQIVEDRWKMGYGDYGEYCAEKLNILLSIKKVKLIKSKIITEGKKYREIIEEQRRNKYN